MVSLCEFVESSGSGRSRSRRSRREDDDEDEEDDDDGDDDDDDIDDDDDDEAGGRGGEEEEGGEELTLKSSNPNLTGGEQNERKTKENLRSPGTLGA